MGDLHPLISVVTISYNSAKVIENTIQSVVNQTFRNYEYIIVDGKSSDKTVHIARKYQKRFEQMGIHFELVSEPDTGIYNAMNKGTRLAHGDWIVFMNSGDCFYNKNVLSSASENLGDRSYGIVYGNHVGTRYGLYKQFHADAFSKIIEDMPFCHQSVYTQRNLLLKFSFDERYKMAADYDFFAKLYNAGIKAKYVDEYFSIYSCDGISYTKTEEMWKERYLARKNNHFINEEEYRVLVRSIDKKPQNNAQMGKLKQRMQKIIPVWVRKIRGIRAERKRLKKSGWSMFVHDDIHRY